MTRIIRIFLLMIVVLLPSTLRAQDQKLAETGKKVYNTYCVICHGDQGDGKGLMGVIHRVQKRGIVVYTYPRDFTAGLFKFRSTPTGYLPTNSDLMEIVTEGIARSGMPSHKELSEADRKAVVEYIKTFSKRWAEETPGTAIKIADVPAYVGTQASLQRGTSLYNDAGCFNCHGKTGKGDGPSSAALKDNWGDKILPFDFTSGSLKGGTEARDIYRTFVTGMDGTPMPSFEEALNEQQRWDIVTYCLEMMKGKGIAQK